MNPNLHSEDDFPTLGGGGAPDVRSWGNNSDSRGDFEKVQSGGRNIDDSTKVNQQLTLGNRYSSLQDWWKIILGPACFITLRSAVM